ncbi:MAG: hypothetical protein AB1744_06235, partial [Candidatus Zixiibacteriota bacterium]
MGRAKLDTDPKDYRGGKALAEKEHCLAAHRVGKIALAVNNNGTIGTGFAAGATDCFTGGYVPSCEYPKNSSTSYLFAGAFWIGAVVGRDTLVSVGADGWQHTREMFPYELDLGIIEKRSIIDPDDPAFENAISEEDYVFNYADTTVQGVDGDYFGRLHQPLNIEVLESSYAWSYSYAEDFVLFDYQIRNIGQRTLENVYMGLYVDADVHDLGAEGGFQDDICGFFQTVPLLETGVAPSSFISAGCDTFLEVNTAWIADNDGDLQNEVPVPHVTGMRIVRTPATELDVSFNWWISNGQSTLDFGPREKPCQPKFPNDPKCPEWKQHVRDFRTGGLGTPEGDVNKYYILRNKEFDYDQAFTAVISPNDPLWLYPATGAVERGLVENFADGYDTRFLLSFGPFEIDPGQRLPVSFAYIAGENFHTYRDNIFYLPDNPEIFYDSLHFNDFATNGVWAS